MDMNRQQGPPTPTDGVEVTSLEELLSVAQDADRLHVFEETAHSLLPASTLRGRLGGRTEWRDRASTVDRPLSAKTPFREKNRREREASDG